MLQISAKQLSQDEYAKLRKMCDFEFTITRKLPKYFLFKKTLSNIMPMNMPNDYVPYANSYEEFIEYYSQVKLERLIK